MHQHQVAIGMDNAGPELSQVLLVEFKDIQFSQHPLCTSSCRTPSRPSDSPSLFLPRFPPSQTKFECPIA
eukprot:2535060-Rhodomonas_salina.2